MFNKNSRTSNAAKASFWGTACNAANTLFGLIYRTVFLYILSANYLGINGLFTNILQVLSFADLGISNAIIYRFYKPISENDVTKVGQLMYFFKNVYRVIALIILIFGLMILPFLGFFIKDATEIPGDINLTVVYLLFLFQTVSSYLFVYRQTILNADQKQHIISLVNSLIVFLRYVIQIVVLVLTKNFVLVLTVNIIWIVLSNYIFSIWIKHRYKEVFAICESIPSDEKKQIYRDTRATLCHKIGSTVLNSTDSIVISKFVGIITTGVYSNYSLLITNLSSVIKQVFGNFTSTLGNAHIEQSLEQKYLSYKRLLFANFWITSVCTVCLFVLINDFVIVWVGEKMLLSTYTVIALCIQFFVETARVISIAYTNGCGLFVKDKIRPLIEASINLVVSIYLVKRIGIAGVFIGTIISHLLTVFWREPYLLYKYEFKKNIKEYWIYYSIAFIGTAVMSVLLILLFNHLPFKVGNFFEWILKAAIVFVCCNAVFILIMRKHPHFLFYKQLILGKLMKNSN